MERAPQVAIRLPGNHTREHLEKGAARSPVFRSSHWRAWCTSRQGQHHTNESCSITRRPTHVPPRFLSAPPLLVEDEASRPRLPEGRTSHRSTESRPGGNTRASAAVTVQRSPAHLVSVDDPATISHGDPVVEDGAGDRDARGLGRFDGPSILASRQRNGRSSARGC